jgi:hypothetical protein
MARRIRGVGGLHGDHRHPSCAVEIEIANVGAHELWPCDLERCADGTFAVELSSGRVVSLLDPEWSATLAPGKRRKALAYLATEGAGDEDSPKRLLVRTAGAWRVIPLAPPSP